MYPLSHANAADNVAMQAYERNKHHQGCTSLSGFLPHNALQEFLKGTYTPPSHCHGKDLSGEYACVLQENDLFGFLVKGLLEHISRQEGHQSQALARRILSQIVADQAAGPTYRKPLHYVGATEEGLGVAIVIDDRFWTDEW